MARKSTRVYVPQIDRVFDNVASAARFLDLDASNINKVLKGKRSQVGGFNFINADSTNGRKPNIAGLRTKADRFIENLSKRQMALQNKSLNTSGLASHPEFIDIKPDFKARRDLRQNLKLINSRIEDLRSKGLYFLSGDNVDEIREQIKSWDKEYSDYYNPRSSDKLPSDVVRLRLASITKRVKDRALNEDFLEDRAKTLGKIFLSETYVKKNSEIFPHVFSLLNKKFPYLDSEQVLVITNDLMELEEENKITGEEIIQQVNNLMDYYSSVRVIYEGFGVSPEELKKLDREDRNDLILLEKMMNQPNSPKNIQETLQTFIDLYKQVDFQSNPDMRNLVRRTISTIAEVNNYDLDALNEEFSLSQEVLQTIEGWR